jgi:hypothetical protein
MAKRFARRFMVASWAAVTLAFGSMGRAQSRDGVRVRGGFSLVAGPTSPRAAESAGTTALGGSVGLAVRLGLQFMHPVGLYLQSFNGASAVGISSADGSLRGVAMFQSQNALLLSFTIAHRLEVAAGPAFDFTRYAGCASETISCSTGAGFSPAIHGRTSLHLGSAGAGPGRFGFDLGLDLHQALGSTDEYSRGGTSVLLGLGLEWH